MNRALANPADVAVAADLSVILGWAGRHREALEVFDAPYELSGLGATSSV